MLSEVKSVVSHLFITLCSSHYVVQTMLVTLYFKCNTFKTASQCRNIQEADFLENFVWRQFGILSYHVQTTRQLFISFCCYSSQNISIYNLSLDFYLINICVTFLGLFTQTTENSTYELCFIRKISVEVFGSTWLEG